MAGGRSVTSSDSLYVDGRTTASISAVCTGPQAADLHKVSDEVDDSIVMVSQRVVRDAPGYELAFIHGKPGRWVGRAERGEAQTIDQSK